MDNEYKYPIAEIFNSLQGEGHHAGTRMTFVRLAGCSVGKPYTPEARKQLGLHVYQERCTAWNGVGFPCDTDYRVHYRLTAAEIAVQIDVVDARRVCITGGEPLIHDLWPLIDTLKRAGKRVHLETSGTISPVPLGVWVTVSPKAGYLSEVLEQANEIKILVGVDFDEKLFVRKFARYFDSLKVFVQPVNEAAEINEDNLRRCIELTKSHPTVRLSSQLHKIWKVL